MYLKKMLLLFLISIYIISIIVLIEDTFTTMSLKDVIERSVYNKKKHKHLVDSSAAFKIYFGSLLYKIGL